MIKYFKALSDLNRLRIINLLMEQKFCVCELEVILKMTQSNASRHLAKLRDSGIVETVKNAQWVYYRLSPSFIEGNEDLYNYLLANRSDETLQDDLDRFRIFRDENLNCLSIRDNKNNVLNRLL